MSVREVLRLENVPVYQNKMFDTLATARACPRGDVVLGQRLDTGLVSNVAFDPGKLDYDESYQNEQGLSSAFKGHLTEVLATIDRHFRAARILEIGCGKGAFLDQMRSDGHDAWGVDPAYEGDAPYIVKAAFEPGLGMRGDAIVMRHVLEHIPQPLDFLDTVRRANDSQGMIYIEVPCLDWILRKRAWFDVFYEHVNYFRLIDFDRMFGAVRESGHLFGGQYLYAVAELASLRDTTHLAADDRVVVPEDFFASIDRCKTQSKAAQRVVWGAAAKGVMFAHHMLARGLDLDFAIDINPAKQGKFLAGSGLPVVSPQQGLARLQRDADIFVMNSNYLDEIKALAGRELNYIPVDGE
jgi:Methyltransferase domain/C-methyltransferase C-terminal domain